MKPPPNDVDQHGFPVPPKFEDDPPRKTPQQPARSVVQRGRAVMILLLVILVGAIIMEAGIPGQGRRIVAVSMFNQAQNRYFDGDLSGAIAKLDSAIWWFPAEPVFYEVRGSWRMEAKDLTGALADSDKVVELLPKSSAAYMSRSLVHQRLGPTQTDEAIADLDKAVEFRTASDPSPFNARAYARAVAGVDLDKALKDAEQAIAFSSVDNSYILDTRGFIYHQMGDEKKALADLDKAIALAEKEKDQRLDQLYKNGVDEKQVGRLTKRLQENLAVMYHHRGLVYQKLGDTTKASADLQQGDRWGYNPAEGVF